MSTTEPTTPPATAPTPAPAIAAEDQGKATSKTPKTLTAKRIKRRMDKIGTSSQPRNLRRKRAKFAQNVLGQIARGMIRNPQAAASAFATALAEQDAAMERAAASETPAENPA